MSPRNVQPAWSSQRSVTKILPSTVPRTFTDFVLISPRMHACSPIVSVPVESTVPSTSPSMISEFANLTEPLIETPRERRAPDGVGMNVRLDGPGTTDGSGRFVCGGSVLLRGEKRVKVCMARIVLNYWAFRKRNRMLVARNFARCAMPVPRRKSPHQRLSLCRWRCFLFAIPDTQAFRRRCRCESTVSCDEDGFEPGTQELDLPCFTLIN
jgi:hypothetical protein